ncbi:MAG: adenylyl-sulfate kinase [Ginsengibacter sp.]
MSTQSNIVSHQFMVNAQKRSDLKNHRSIVLWFTGLSGSGKSTISDRLEQLLFNAGIHTYLLDGDNIRLGLNKGLGFTKEDREENLRRIAEVAKLFVDAGLVVLSAFVSPLIKDREMVKEIIGADNFMEIYVNTSLEECERRDVKGFYKKARTGEIKNFTGISAPYEPPIKPAIEINTQLLSAEESALAIYKQIIDNLRNH